MLVMGLILKGEMVKGEDTVEQPVSKVSFTGKYVDYKVHDDETGMNYLKVDLGVDVKEEGDYVILGFLGEASLEGMHGFDRKDLHLKKGIQTVTLSFDGNTIFEGKFKKFVLFDLSVEEREPGYEIFDRRKGVALSSYDYQEFRRTKIFIKDKGVDFSTIIEGLVGGPNESQEIKEVSLEEFLGLKIFSSQYVLYSYDLPMYHFPPRNPRYIAIAKNKSIAFFIEDIESFNDFISLLNTFPKNDKELIQITEAFLRIFPYRSLRILWELPKGEEDKSGGGGVSFRIWFATHITYKFHPPKVTKIGTGYSVEYYSWRGNGGTLAYQYFELKENGEILKDEERVLGERIGPYVII